jgi:hypothetical protein
VDKGKNPYGNLLLNLSRGNYLFIVNGPAAKHINIVLHGKGAMPTFKI